MDAAPTGQYTDLAAENRHLLEEVDLSRDTIHDLDGLVEELDTEKHDLEQQNCQLKLAVHQLGEELKAMASPTHRYASSTLRY